MALYRSSQFSRRRYVINRSRPPHSSQSIHLNRRRKLPNSLGTLMDVRLRPQNTKTEPSEDEPTETKAVGSSAQESGISKPDVLIACAEGSSPQKSRKAKLKAPAKPKKDGIKELRKQWDVKILSKTWVFDGKFRHPRGITVRITSCAISTLLDPVLLFFRRPSQRQIPSTSSAVPLSQIWTSVPFHTKAAQRCLSTGTR